jgi:hypothetical protein
MSDNYGPLSLNQAPLMFTERRTAEMIKYAANAFLATITFINEVRRRLRKSPRQRAGGRARHRPGKPHRRPIRMQVQASAVVLSEGYEGADQDCEGSRRVLALSSRSTRIASARWREE